MVFDDDVVVVVVLVVLVVLVVVLVGLVVLVVVLVVVFEFIVDFCLIIFPLLMGFEKL